MDSLMFVCFLNTSVKINFFPVLGYNSSFSVSQKVLPYLAKHSSTGTGISLRLNDKMWFYLPGDKWEATAWMGSRRQNSIVGKWEMHRMCATVSLFKWAYSTEEPAHPVCHRRKGCGEHELLPCLIPGDSSLLLLVCIGRSVSSPNCLSKQWGWNQGCLPQGGSWILLLQALEGNGVTLRKMGMPLQSYPAQGAGASGTTKPRESPSACFHFRLSSEFVIWQGNEKEVSTHRDNAKESQPGCVVTALSHQRCPPCIKTSAVFISQLGFNPE